MGVGSIATVSAVANGAPSGGGCIDTDVVAKGTYNVPIASIGDVTACNTMKDTATFDPATNLKNFYSTTNQGCKDTDPDHGDAGDLRSIFLKFGFGLVRATLIPNSSI